MSDPFVRVERYYISGLHPHIWKHPEGEMVYFDDYVNLWAEMSRLKAEVERLRKAGEWQPIETAPNDGTEILTYNDISGIHQVSWSYGNRSGHWETERWLDRETNWVIDPTHWVPLPKPPAAKDGKPTE
jgi:hypothetical protein